MAKKSTSFVDEHIEKVVVGVCGLVLLTSVYVGMGSGRFELNGKQPDDLKELVANEAEQVARNIKNATRPAPKPAGANSQGKDAVAQLEQWFGEDAPGLLAMVESPAGRTQPFPPIFYSTTETSREDRHGLAVMVAPDIPVVSAGRSVFQFPEELPPLEKYTGAKESRTLPATTRNWVCVAAQIDLVQQDIYYKTQKYPKGAFPTIVQVHLERFDQNEAWRGWQPVDTYLPYIPPEMPEMTGASGALSLQGMTDFKDLLVRKQEYVARPTIGNERVAGDRIYYPGIPYFPEPPHGNEKNPEKGWYRDAQKASQGRSPFDVEDLDAAMLLSRAVLGRPGVSESDRAKAQSLFDTVVKDLKRTRKNWAPGGVVRPPERMMPIVAYDMSAVPGHTYTYRIRYEVLNIFAGNTGELLDPADAEKMTVFSGWSPETRPVRIESDTYFYLTKADDKKNEVTVTVYKKKGRDAAKQATFKVQVGAEIGGEKRRGKSKVDFSTGAICLDIDFNRKIDGRTDVSLVYVDTTDGSVHEKLLSIDKKDKFREALESEETARR